MTEFRDRQGEDIPLLTWAKLYENHDYRQIALDKVGKTHVVSTIWEGMVIPWREGIFETAILVHGNITDILRAHTEEQAMENHKKAVDTASRKGDHVEDR